MAEGQPPKKDDVTSDDFFALDLRVGRVEAVEAFPEARRPAWKLTVDFGPEVGVLRGDGEALRRIGEAGRSGGGQEGRVGSRPNLFRQCLVGAACCHRARQS